MELTREEAQLLAELGFVGISRGRNRDAEMVFYALYRMRPKEEAAIVGLAMARLSQGNPAGALAVLTEARQTETVMAFAAVAHGSLGDLASARELAEELDEIGAPEALRAIARSAAQADQEETTS